MHHLNGADTMTLNRSDLDATFDQHKDDCMKMLELKFVRKNPGLSIAAVISTLVIVSGTLAYYYSAEGRQNERHFSAENRIEQVTKEVRYIADRQDKIDKEILEGQSAILLEIKELKHHK
ncbi:hypothetical protein CCP3SC15_300008 [Gammaproteobacteria bacterium]